MKKFLSAGLLFLCIMANAQSGTGLYMTAGPYFFRVNLPDCETCLLGQLLPSLGGDIFDLLVLPNGDILTQTPFGLDRYTPPFGGINTPSWSAPGSYSGSIIGPDGNIYLNRLSAPAGLVLYNPTNNTLNYIGPWPAGYQISEFFVQNGTLYAAAYPTGLPPQVLQVNLTTPDLSTVVATGSPISFLGGVSASGYNNTLQGLINPVINLYDVNTNTNQVICQFDYPPGIPTLGVAPFRAMTEWAPGLPALPCPCFNFAAFINPAPINACVGNPVTIPLIAPAILAPNDIVQYILFTDLADTLGSILVQSNTNSFTFNPATMQTGIIYYVASISGNNLNGNVDINDPCFDISVVATLVWREKPSVAFTANGPSELCAGACQSINASFTGVPPFVLSYTSPAGAFSQNFTTASATFDVCVPISTATGPIQIQAISVTDAFCQCN